MKSISIVGCGWLGLPLAIKLQSQDYIVTGTSRSHQKLTQLKEQGIIPVQLDLTPKNTLPRPIIESDIVVFNIPPRIKVQGIEFYQATISNFVNQIKSKTSQFIFISTTSVYENKEGYFSENMANPEHPLYHVEQTINDSFQNALILRCAGLVGPDRIIVDSLERKMKSISPETPVNLVKRVDVIRAIETGIASSNSSGTYNICSDAHPTKRECYGKWAQRFDHKIHFTDSKETGKTISNDAFKTDFGFRYQFPDPLDFFD